MFCHSHMPDVPPHALCFDVITITIMIFIVEVVLERRANKHRGGRSHQSPVAVSTAAQAKRLPLLLS